MAESRLKEMSTHGRLTLLQRFRRAVGLKGCTDWFWYCICDCGGTVLTRCCSITSGSTKSCGCLQRESAIKNAQKATSMTRKYSKEDSESGIYKRWRGIIKRVKYIKPNNRNYSVYKGKGINICKEWELFENFKRWSLENGYSPELTIDRIDGNKGYSPDNCRFITMSENLKNRNLYRDRKSVV